MKSQILSALVFVSMTGLTAHALEMKSAASVWEGSGLVMDVDGKQITNYELKVVNTEAGSDVQSDVTVKLENGKVIHQLCTTTPKPDSTWSDVCDFGKGGGRDFGDGLSISYLASGEHAFSTTIVMDGPGQMRLLRVELQNGKAVRFFREKLHKKD